MTVSIRLNNEDSELFKSYAKMNGISVSELVRKSVLEKIEDEYDLELFQKALASYRMSPQTATLAEAEKELGL